MDKGSTYGKTQKENLYFRMETIFYSIFMPFILTKCKRNTYICHWVAKSNVKKLCKLKSCMENLNYLFESTLKSYFLNLKDLETLEKIQRSALNLQRHPKKVVIWFWFFFLQASFPLYGKTQFTAAAEQVRKITRVVIASQFSILIL